MSDKTRCQLDGKEEKGKTQVFTVHVSPIAQFLYVRFRRQTHGYTRCAVGSVVLLLCRTMRVLSEAINYLLERAWCIFGELRSDDHRPPQIVYFFPDDIKNGRKKHPPLEKTPDLGQCFRRKEEP